VFWQEVKAITIITNTIIYVDLFIV